MVLFLDYWRNIITKMKTNPNAEEILHITTKDKEEIIIATDKIYPHRTIEVWRKFKVRKVPTAQEIINES